MPHGQTVCRVPQQSGSCTNTEPCRLAGAARPWAPAGCRPVHGSCRAATAVNPQGAAWVHLCKQSILDKQRCCSKTRIRTRGAADSRPDCARYTGEGMSTSGATGIHRQRRGTRKANAPVGWAPAVAGTRREPVRPSRGGGGDRQRSTTAGTPVARSRQWPRAG